MMLVIIAIGYGITKLGMFSNKARSDATNIIIMIVLPCSIFNSFHKGMSPEIMIKCGIVLLISFGIQIFCFVLNKFIYRRIAHERRAVLQFATLINNASFMGLPILETVFGDAGLLYGSIVLIPLRIFTWTVGLSLYTGTKDKKSVDNEKRSTSGLIKEQIKKTWKKLKPLITHPCIWAVVLGFAYAFSPFTLPEFLSKAINSIGICNTALSMMVVGSILSDVNLKEIFDKDCFYYSLIRLILIPLFAYGVLTLLRIDTLVASVTVLSTAMPAAMTTAMLADRYGRDAAFASKTILVSTVLSLVTLPLISAFLTSRL